MPFIRIASLPFEQPVITSYSIHYTKLYDHLHLQVMRTSKRCAPLLRQAYQNVMGCPAVDAAPRRGGRVITSYSIHYTKLYEDRSGWRRRGRG